MNDAIPEMSLTPEQMQELARVNRLESEIAPAPVDEQGNEIVEAPPVDAGAENTAILGLIVDMLTPAAPFLAQCYTPDVIKRIALAYTAVEEKRGWNARAFLSVEAQLAIVAIPPTLQAFVFGREYFRQRAIENKLPWFLKWLRRKKVEKPLGDDRQDERGE